MFVTLAADAGLSVGRRFGEYRSDQSFGMAPDQPATNGAK
jgi:hypothetical protein